MWTRFSRTRSAGRLGAMATKAKAKTEAPKLPYTPKQQATILQRRCTYTVASIGKITQTKTLSKRGIIRVGPVLKLGGDEYYFDISEQDQFDFRGRMRREMVWSARIIINDKHDVTVMEDAKFDPIPPGILDCVKAAIEPSDMALLEGK